MVHVKVGCGFGFRVKFDEGRVWFMLRFGLGLRFMVHVKVGYGFGFRFRVRVKFECIRRET